MAWYENTDGRGRFGPQQVITTSADGAASVIAADIDGDGDLDVFSGSTFDDKVAWYENTDGKGAFGPQRVITTFPDAVRSIFAADIDHDGDQDVLSVSIGDGKIAWHKNTDGMGTFGPQQVIANLTNGANSVFATDIDGDSDQDVLFASPGGDKIAWFENINRRGLFGAEQNINMPDPDSDGSNDVNGNADNARSVFAADLDGDGDQDVLSASFEDDKIAWYENLRPPTAVLDWELYD